MCIRDRYKDTLKKNDYKDCDLLCSKDITATGVYYVDYAELNKKGDYINYIMEYKFSDAGEKVYLKACAAGAVSYTHLDVYKRQSDNRTVATIGSTKGG